MPHFNRGALTHAEESDLRDARVALYRDWEDNNLRAAAIDTLIEVAYGLGVMSVTRIRCVVHRDVPQYNTAAASDAECAACATGRVWSRASSSGEAWSR